MPPKTPSRRRPNAGMSDSDPERKPPTPTPSKSSSNGSNPGGGGGSGGSFSGDRSTESAVRVVVRVRPQNKKEIDAGGKVCVSFPSEVRQREIRFLLVPRSNELRYVLLLQY